MKLIELDQMIIDLNKLAQNDSEAAHIKEKDIWRQVLKAVANHDIPAIWAAELARKALDTEKIDFTRCF